MANTHYYIKDSDCLKNKLGITDKDELAQIEADVTGTKIIGLKENPLPGKIDYSYFKEIHKTLFDDLYDWAGTERDISVEKGGFNFEFDHRIVQSAENLFAELGAEDNLKGLERTEFIERAVHYFEELNFVHPFPEGNGRAQRVLFDQIAKEAGREFDWGHTSKDQFIGAVILASGGNYAQLEAVFDQALIEPGRSIELDKTTELDLTVTNPIEKADYTKATKALRDKVSELSVPLRQEAEKEIDAVQNKVEVLDRQIQKHIDTKPRPTMLSNSSANEKLADWNHNRKVLIAERDGLLRHVKNARSGDIHQQSEGSIMKQAEKRATKSLPIESKLIKEFEADRTIKQLSEQLQNLDKKIDREQRDPENPKVIPRALKEKSRILTKLKNNKTLNERLSVKSKNALSVQAKAVNLTLSRFSTKSLDRGR